jgi:hypothetical protein
MLRKLMALGLFLGMAGLAACEPRDEPAFEDDFRFEEAPPATPAPAPIDTPMDPMMDPMAPDTPVVDTLPQQPEATPQP